MKIFNLTRQKSIANNAFKADTFVDRAKGLLDREKINFDEALIITHCQSIHMFFMRFAIDVIFVDRKNVVVGLVENIQPFCLSPVFFNADYAIELPVGVIAESQTALGDSISIS